MASNRVTIPQKATDKIDYVYLNRFVKERICEQGGINYLEELAQVLLPGGEGKTQIRIIAKNYPGDVKSCFTEFFNVWSEREVDSTWQKLMDALRSTSKRALAREIENMLLPPQLRQKDEPVEEENKVTEGTPDDSNKTEHFSYKELKSKNFMQKYLKAKSDLGTEKLKLLKVLFFGPPGAGKSTLLSVLLNQDIRALRESTGMLDRILVQFKVAVQKHAESSISQWTTVAINEEILRLRHTIDNIIEMRDSQEISDSSTALTTQLKPDMRIDEKLQSVAIDLKNDSVQQNFVTSNSLIACYDSGGQSEFFDVMPAFVTATTGNIMIFDMSKDLHSKIDPEFFKNGQCLSPSDAKTHYTGAQLLKTALANIQSYATRYDSCSTVNRHSRSNQLLVVGTHLDLCGNTENEVYQKLRKVEEIICDDVLHDSSGITEIKRSKEKYTNIIHPIANKCHKETIRNREEAAQEIRSAIESMCENHSVNNEIPISWLLFQYEIKLCGGPCILRSDCEQIAEQSYIDEKDVNDVLFFFHELGILLYYKDVKSLRHVVFSDPQWLFTQLTKLIELKYCALYETRKSIRKGIFKKEFLAEICKEEFEAKDVLQYEDIFNLFVHLNIMARLSDSTEEYFMPALLDPIPNNISINVLFGDEVYSTLYIKFKNGFFPRGVFCCLIASSIQKIKNWKLQLNAAYKDLVVFQIEKNKEYLVLSDKIHFISVEIHRKEKLPKSQHHSICHTLYKKLKELCHAIHLDGDFKFGFLCENDKNFASVEMQYPCCPESLSCDHCQHTSRMTYEQLVWFVPPEVLDIKSESSMALSYGYYHK